MTNKEIKRKINSKYRLIQSLMCSLPDNYTYDSEWDNYKLSIYSTEIEIVHKKPYNTFEIFSSDKYIEEQFHKYPAMPLGFSGLMTADVMRNSTEIIGTTRTYLSRFSRPKQLKILNQIERQLSRLLLELA
jgi:hypothetical protein